MRYMGNGIYDYIESNNLNYYFRTGTEWLLIYGDEKSQPLLFALVTKAENKWSNTGSLSYDETKAKNIADELKLPFISIQYQTNIDEVKLKMGENLIERQLSYNELKNLYHQKYKIPIAGKPKKTVNQYTSSSYHDWQRENLGNGTVSDIDLIKMKNNKIEALIELKRAHIPLDEWRPFTKDYNNFTLLANTIVNSGENIDFLLYYNLLEKANDGERKESIDSIKTFQFLIPEQFISPNELKYKYTGIHTTRELLEPELSGEEDTRKKLLESLNSFEMEKEQNRENLSPDETGFQL